MSRLTPVRPAHTRLGAQLRSLARPGSRSGVPSGLRSRLLSGVVVASLAGLAGCDQSDPSPAAFNGDLRPVTGKVDYFERFQTLTIAPAGTPGVEAGGAGASAINPAELERRAVLFVQQSERLLECAFHGLRSEALAQALVAAKARGVDVRVAADEDARDEIGFGILEAGGVVVRYGDGPLQWAPQPGLDVDRTGDTNLMTHNVIIADGLRVMGVTGGFNGPDDNLWQLGFAAASELLGRDFQHTIKQLHAGTFATTLTVFGASTSADGNFRTVYPTEDGMVEAWFGPSEPITKQLIDEVYHAKASVWFAGEALINEALVDALRYKLAAGFKVSVILAPGAPRPYGADHPLAAVTVEGPPFTGTVVVLDAEPSPIDGRRWAGQTLFATQPTGAVVAFGDEIRPGIRAGNVSDIFSDGHLIGVRQAPARSSNPDFAATVAWYRALLAEANR